MLTVACVWVKSETYDSIKWVSRLYSMVQRNLFQPFRFVCITPHGNDFKTVWCFDGADHFITTPPRIIPPSNYLPWWYKLNLFDLGVWGEQVLYLDLDTVVVGLLDPLVNYPSDFVMSPSSGNPAKGHDYNSSVMMWKTTSSQVEYIRSKIPPDYKRYPGDQQWLCSLPIQVDAYPHKWIRKYLPGKGIQEPPEGTIVSLMIQGGKNQALLDAGHTWIGKYWHNGTYLPQD